MPLSITTSGARCSNAEEEVERVLGAVLEHGDAALGVDRADPNAWHELDPALGEGVEQRLGSVGGGGTGLGSCIRNVISQSSRTPRSVR